MMVFSYLQKNIVQNMMNIKKEKSKKIIHTNKGITIFLNIKILFVTLQKLYTTTTRVFIS